MRSIAIMVCLLSAAVAASAADQPPPLPPGSAGSSVSLRSEAIASSSQEPWDRAIQILERRIKHLTNRLAVLEDRISELEAEQQQPAADSQDVRAEDATAAGWLGPYSKQIDGLINVEWRQNNGKFWMRQKQK